MKGLQWKMPALALVLFILALPSLQRANEGLSREIEQAKLKLAGVEDLMRHREDYLNWQQQVEAQGESLWGSPDPSNFVGELQLISDQVGTSILNIRPIAQESSKTRGTIGVEVEMEGDMKSVARFIYEALSLPGLVRLEQINLSDAGRGEHVISAHLYLSRRLRSV